VVAFCQRFIVMPKGTGARKHMVVRPWQRDRIGEVFDPGPRPRFALWSMPRGQGKSAMASAIGLYALHADGVDDASVVVVAADERQAGIVFNTAVRMTELSKPLLERTQVSGTTCTSPGRARRSRCCRRKPTGSRDSTRAWRSSTRSAW
jgi:phage terminase large subunit-like protein